MACVDCHTALEAMGSDQSPLHEEQATRVRCETCHRIQPSKSLALADLKPEDRSIVRLRYGDAAPARYLVEEATGDAITNAIPLPDGTVEIHSKLDGKAHIAKPPSPACAQLPGHARLSCRACHESWATRCISCHTQVDTKGNWTEYDAPPQIGPPTMGILERQGRAQIVPFAPGMIMTLNGPSLAVDPPLPSSAKDLITPRSKFLRAYSPVVPHTTTRKGLSCADCHSDPHALGFGTGAYENSSFDGKPQDAWIGSLDASSGVSTRIHARSFNVDEQKRILAVGKCLPCHDPANSADFYAHFDESLKGMRPECRR
jgi:hypothetical protein